MSPYNTEGQLSLALSVAIGCEPAFAGAAGTILPVPTLSPFAVIEKCYERVIVEFFHLDCNAGAQRVTDLFLGFCAAPQCAPRSGSDADR